jgi:PAS domain S-box-containing protein
LLKQMRARPSKNPWLFALLAVVLVFVTEQVIEHFARSSELEQEKNAVNNTLSTLRARLEGVVTSNLLLVHGLTAVISAQPDIDQAGFARIARGLVDERHALRNIAGAPDMVNSLMYPMAGNEAAIGLDYRTHPTQREAALRAMESGQSVIAGPLPLVQGGTGIIAREPVFTLSDAAGGKRRFWGLVSAVIDADVLYRQAGLGEVSPNLRLAIRAINTAGAPGPVFHGDASVFALSPVSKQIVFPGGEWQLAAVPAAGWGQASQTLWMIRLLGLLAALTAAVLAYLLAQRSQALADSEVRLRALLNTIPDLVWLKDPDGVYLACNPRFEQLYGASEADIVGKTDYDFAPVELADFFRANDRAAIAAGHPRSNEEWLTFAADAHRELVETIKTPVYGAANKLIGVLGIARNITERKQNEQRIQGLNRIYAVLSGINEAIVRLREPQALYDEACRIAVELGGFRMAWLGMADSISGEVRPLAQAGKVDGYIEHLHISLGDDERARGPTGTALKAGRHAVCNDIANDPRMAPWRDAALALDYRASAAFPIRVAGQVRGAFNLYDGSADFFDDAELRLLDELALDIGFALEFIEVDNARETLNRRMLDLLESMSDGFVSLDREWRYRYVNRKAGEMFGRVAADLVGKHIWTEFPEGVGQPFQQAYEQAMNGAEAVCLEEYFAPWGQWFENRIYPTREGISIFFTDISARKRAEAEIRQLNAELEERVRARTAELAATNKELETFTYSVSHDLKAPLRGIDGYSRLLLEDHLGQLNEEGRLFIGNVRHGVEQMSQLIEDLLAYSRMERRDLHGVPLDLARQIAAVLNERAEEISARGIEVKVELDALTAHADPDGLALVLRNLIDNALKFSRDSRPPMLTISGSLTEKSVTLAFTDNGIGFDMQFQDRIFEIFQRLQRAEDYPGTGVGLAIVRKAMQRMGGRVWASSAPGQGATFYLELPR